MIPDTSHAPVLCPGCGAVLTTVTKDSLEGVDEATLFAGCKPCTSMLFVRVRETRHAHDPWTRLHLVEVKRAVVRGKSVEWHRGPNPWEVVAEIR